MQTKASIHAASITFITVKIHLRRYFQYAHRMPIKASNQGQILATWSHGNVGSITALLNDGVYEYIDRCNVGPYVIDQLINSLRYDLRQWHSNQ